MDARANAAGKHLCRDGPFTFPPGASKPRILCGGSVAGYATQLMAWISV